MERRFLEKSLLIFVHTFAVVLESDLKNLASVLADDIKQYLDTLNTREIGKVSTSVVLKRLLQRGLRAHIDQTLKVPQQNVYDNFCCEGVLIKAT